MNDRYRWAAPGDVNAFFGLVLDNIAGMVLIVSLFSGFGMPTDMIIQYMIQVPRLAFLWVIYSFSSSHFV